MANYPTEQALVAGRGGTTPSISERNLRPNATKPRTGRGFVNIGGPLS